MHIPDGYISPQTAVVLYAAATPFWWLAGRKVKEVLTARAVPVLSLLAAFTFTIMMFNIPLPGGTSAHATGAVLTAVVLGPWAAVIATSVALVIQALLFGDGGITAIGANCFNLAIAMPLSGYSVYRLLSLGAPLTARRQVWAAAAGAYVGINVAALLTAVELGLQPLLFMAADGTPLYSPFSLSQALPAMMIGHLTIAGAAEALVTGLVIGYLQRANLAVLSLRRGRQEATSWAG
ncbi:MAG: cobalt transporter CbiM [Chloroflexota bacterium]